MAVRIPPDSRAQEAEPQVVVPVVRVVPVAIGRAHVPGSVVPGTPAVDAVGPAAFVTPAPLSLQRHFI